jgi:spore germination cell wall hydrolase CwlJ-like protein
LNLRGLNANYAEGTLGLAVPDARSLADIMDGEGDGGRFYRRLKFTVFGAVTFIFIAAVALIMFNGSFGSAGGAIAQKDPLEAAYKALVASQPIPVVETAEVADISMDSARAINAAMPFSNVVSPPARPFVMALDQTNRLRATECLASAVWYEAGGDWIGQRAVAQVVLNRVRHPAFPKSVCGVVFQGSERRTGCQFSYTCDGALRRQPAAEAWRRSIAIAEDALNGFVFPQVGLATHYHTDWVAPKWSPKMEKITAVHTHLFFRWKGSWGQPVAFLARPSGTEPVILKLARISAAHRQGIDPELLAKLDSLESLDSVPASLDPVNGLAPLAPDPSIAAFGAPDIGKINLRGSELMLIHPDADAFVLRLGSGTAGSYALAALDLCKGKGFCKVMGWKDLAAMPRRFPIGSDASDQMAFYYQHQNGQDYVQWDCRQIPNAPKDKCLPVTDAPVPQSPTP